MESINRNALDGAMARMLPVCPGSYVLVLRMPAACRLAIGRSLDAELDPGYYLYVGSALGGLRGRLQRYLTGPERIHWHIDYLLQVSRLCEIWYREGSERLECVWASRLRQGSGVAPAIPRFGSSDCRCPTHLLYAARRPSSVLLGEPAVQVLPIAPQDQMAAWHVDSLP
ncbi:MAG: GIY-YIG nuclease family protein [Anaerolineae bacterium]